MLSRSEERESAREANARAFYRLIHPHAKQYSQEDMAGGILYWFDRLFDLYADLRSLKVEV